MTLTGYGIFAIVGNCSSSAWAVAFVRGSLFLTTFWETQSLQNQTQFHIKLNSIVYYLSKETEQDRHGNLFMREVTSVRINIRRVARRLPELNPLQCINLLKSLKKRIGE